MIKHADHFHGSDLEKIENIYNIKKEDITSFSANVNPLGISPKLKKTLADKLDVITSYPDREYTSLRRCIASYAKTDIENIIVGNGSTELISIFIQLKQPKKAVIIGPTYSEYEREISLGKGSSLYFPLLESDDFQCNLDALIKALEHDVDLLVICNPNNPTSSAITRNNMKKILDECKQRDIFVLIDETYVEFAVDMDQITSVPLTNIYNNVLILRGISKFFAAPGLRLGYAICGNEDLLKQLNQHKNPWTINSLATIAGEMMFSDYEYIDATKNLINSERSRIMNKLSSCNNLKVYPCVANFLLVKILKDNVTALDLFDACIKKGLMIRNCASFPFLDEKYVRFCFMSPEKNDELLDIFFQILK